MAKSKVRPSAAKFAARVTRNAARAFARRTATIAHKTSPTPRAVKLNPGRNNRPPASRSAAIVTCAIRGTTARVGIDESIKGLVRLAQEQGYLTYNDINDALPDRIHSSAALDEIYVKLRNLEIEIVDQAEVDRVKQAGQEEDDDKSRLDILDDPVRMYLKQMGQVPLLTREQEVGISKRIEEAENEVKKIIYNLGFAGKEHIALAEKLVSEPPKERFDRVILEKKTR